MTKKHLRLVFGFLCIIVLYHILVVGGVFGAGWGEVARYALVRDFLRAVIVLIIAYDAGQKKIRRFFEYRGYEYVILLLLIGFAIGLSVMRGQPREDILIGYKYDIHFLVIALSAVFIGFVGLQEKQKWQTLIAEWCWKGVCWILIGGVVFQLIKMLLPDLFLGWGYGPIGDYVVGADPPIRYRTGPGGVARLQGIFSGPNNFGYFLVGSFAFFVMRTWRKFDDMRAKDGSFVFFSNKKRWVSVKLFCLFLLFVGALFWTLSRGALIGVLVQVIILVLFAYKRFLRDAKKMLMTILYVAIGLGCVIWFLSLFKSGSTALHLLSRQEGWVAFVANPRGYGLGMAGPSVHHHGVYLPESQYLQIALNLGWVGILLRLIVRKILLNPSLHHLQHDVRVTDLPIYTFIGIGIFGLMVEGLFLHVREDSMVNYLLLVPFGILLGMSRESPMGV